MSCNEIGVRRPSPGRYREVAEAAFLETIDNDPIVGKKCDTTFASAD